MLGLALLGLVQGGPVVDQCVRQCQQVYSLNQANFEQVGGILLSYGKIQRDCRPSQMSKEDNK